ncbi:unnamed protein product [Sphagnum troendelagicum]|uniref:Partial AB-hydrolase lipase domain-containing protein n=1 Tax=Sphagnum troendelagicum TaxID=128251 RepID=A0ABP0UFF3_9BRYO
MSRNQVDPPPHHQHPPHGLMQQTNEFGSDLQWRRTVVVLIMMMMSVCLVLQSGAATSYNNDEFVKLKKVIKTMDVTTSSSSGVINKDTAATDRNSKLGLCASIIQGYGYPCQEITVQTRDGFLLGLQHIPHGLNEMGLPSLPNKPLVFLQHGVLQGGDDWVLNNPQESLGFMLADHGYDVWIGNMRGTRWSHGHIYLTPSDDKFWDWSFDEQAAIDLPALLGYIYNSTHNKVYYVGHSQGSTIALAAFTMPATGVADIVKGAVLLAPIAYLNHVKSKLLRAAADLMIDKVFISNSDVGKMLIDLACKHDGVICEDIISAVLGTNCCVNHTRFTYYLEWEPQPTSTKDMQHLAQMVRSGLFSFYDYGTEGNLKVYNQTKPPLYNLATIPKELPLFLISGGNDPLADPEDVEKLQSDLLGDVTALQIANYSHGDLLVSYRANIDVNAPILAYFRELETRSSAKTRL